MPLTPKEEARLQSFIDSHNVSKPVQKRIRQIAEMSKDGYSLKEIKKQVSGSTEFVTENRRKLRWVGVW